MEALGGVWCSPEAVDKGLQRPATGKRGEARFQLEAIKDQINFRKKVMQQNFTQREGAFSQNGVAFSQVEMTEKLNKIISA